MAYNRKQTFRPISFNEMMAPLLQYKEEYDKLAEEYSKLQAGTERWKDLAETDPEVASRYGNYASELNKIVDDFSQGMTSRNNRGALLSLRKGYVDNILPIETAYGIKSNLIKNQDDARAKDNTTMFTRDARDISLGEIMKDNHIGYGATSSGNNIRKMAQEAAEPIAKVFRELSRLNIDNLTLEDRAFMESRGISTNELMLFKNGDPAFLETETGRMLHQIINETVGSSDLYKSLDIPEMDENGDYIFSDDKNVAAKQRRSVELLEQMTDYAQQGLWKALGQNKIEFRRDPAGSSSNNSSNKKKEEKPFMNYPITPVGVDGKKSPEATIISDVIPTADGGVTTPKIADLDNKISKARDNRDKPYTKEQIASFEKSDTRVDEQLNKKRSWAESLSPSPTEAELVRQEDLLNPGYRMWRYNNKQVSLLEREAQKEIKKVGDVLDTYSHLVSDISSPEAIEFLQSFIINKDKYVNYRMQLPLQDTQNKKLAKNIRNQFDSLKGKKTPDGIYLLDKNGQFKREIKPRTFDRLFNDKNLDRIVFNYTPSEDPNKPSITISLGEDFYGIKGSQGLDNARVNSSAVHKFLNDFNKEPLTKDSVSLGELNPTTDDLLSMIENNDITPLIEKAKDLGRRDSGYKGITIQSDNIPGRYIKLLFHDNGDGYKLVCYNTVNDIAEGNIRVGEFMKNVGAGILDKLYGAYVGEAEEGRIG